MAALEYNEEDIDSRRGNERLIHWMMAEGFLHDSMRCGRDLTQMRLERDPNISKDHFLVGDAHEQTVELESA